MFETKGLGERADLVAADGSDVRVLLALSGGSMAHFTLAADGVSTAVAHRTVDEIWFVVSGHGQMWRRQDAAEAIVDLAPGVCVSIPRGTHFQFRATRTERLAAVAVTMPPWPGDGEAYTVRGAWTPTRP